MYWVEFYRVLSVAIVGGDVSVNEPLHILNVCKKGTILYEAQSDLSISK